jgi:hypothetical protein
MPSIIDPETRDALRAIGCLKGEQLNGSALAHRLAAHLEDNHLSQNLDDVETVEVTAAQLVTAVVGRADAQLIDAAKPLLNVGAKGAVQRALADGYVLCSRRTHIELDVGGEIHRSPIATRFLSADHDVLQQYVLQARQDRANAFVKNTQELTAMVEKRQPGMADRIASFLEDLSVVWERQLGTGSGS